MIKAKDKASESKKDVTTADTKPVIHAGVGAEEEFKAVLLERFGEPAQAFEGLKGKGGVVAAKDWKAAIKFMMPSLSKDAAKVLRRRLPKNADLRSFIAFLSDNDGERATDEPDDEASSGGRLAKLPTEVPGEQ